MRPEIERSRAEAEDRESLAVLPGPDGTIGIEQIVNAPRRRGRPPKVHSMPEPTQQSPAPAASPQKAPGSIPSLPAFSWKDEDLGTCSRHLKSLQDEAARGIAILSQRHPREETVECWCLSPEAMVNGKLPPFAEGGDHIIGPGRKFKKYVASITQRQPDGQLANVFFATTMCYLKWQQRRFGTKDLPNLIGR